LQIKNTSLIRKEKEREMGQQYEKTEAKDDNAENMERGKVGRQR
jgi:hypothetical protein